MADLTIHQLIVELTKAQSRSVVEVDKVVARGAYNIKQDAIRRISGHPHLPAYPRSITYDLFHWPGSSRAEIGPDKDRRQGSMGNIIEYGTTNNAPLPHLGPALEAEGPKFARALEQLGVDLLDG
jgi:hypothetical protein